MTNGNGAPPEQAPPQLNVLAQYTKDLSFENPNAPASLAPQQQQPNINIQINVAANNISESEFEVTLSIEGKAENAGKVMFSFELAYAGVFRIVNVPQENLHPLIMIECPRLLFPFAREIISTATRNGARTWSGRLPLAVGQSRAELTSGRMGRAKRNPSMPCAEAAWVSLRSTHPTS